MTEQIAKSAKSSEPVACACGAFDVLVNVRETANGDLTWDQELSTGCTATTRNTFAPGHDAKLKGLAIKAAVLGEELRRDEGGVRVSGDPIDMVEKMFGFGHMVAEGLARHARLQDEKAKRATARATKSVFNWLDRRRDNDMWSSVGESFPMDSVEEFAKAAKAWLGDKSELSGKTIEAADYTEIRDWFAQFVAPRAPHVSVNAIAEDANIGGTSVNAIAPTPEPEPEVVEDEEPAAVLPTVQAKVGRWIYSGNVIDGAFHYADKNGNTKATDKFTLIEG